MSNPTERSPRRRRLLLYLLTILATACATAAILALLTNIFERKQEAKEHFLRLVEQDESTIDPAVWGRNFPRQYDSYRLTADSHSGDSGSDAFSPSRLEADPRLVRIFSGYPFSVDFREARGHAYMLSDQDISERTQKFKQPGACLHCHASIIPAYREAGNGDVMAGFEKVCAMPLKDARQLAEHPVACIDCHDPESMQLRVTRPGFLNGIQELAKSDVPLPHMPSIERWRKSDRTADYDANALASRQEMRTFVCGQCHVEYYFKGDGKLLTFPWHSGLKVDEIEAYYDGVKHIDWVHEETGAPMLKAQHPEFETWSQGVHARSGVSCADCHMPYKREGAVKVSDHHVRSPMENAARACQTCHRYPEEEIQARVEIVQERTRKLMDRAEDALVQLMDTVKTAKARGVPDAKLEEARRLHRKAQWRLDFVNAENSLGFHAPQETARILGEAIDYARQAQLSAATQQP